MIALIRWRSPQAVGSHGSACMTSVRSDLASSAVHHRYPAPSASDGTAPGAHHRCTARQPCHRPDALTETLTDAVRRSLGGKAGVNGVPPRQLHVFDDPDRDERGWVHSVAHVAVVRPEQPPSPVIGRYPPGPGGHPRPVDQRPPRHHHQGPARRSLPVPPRARPRPAARRASSHCANYGCSIRRWTTPVNRMTPSNATHSVAESWTDSRRPTPSPTASEAAPPNSSAAPPPERAPISAARAFSDSFLCAVFSYW